MTCENVTKSEPRRVATVGFVIIVVVIALYQVNSLKLNSKPANSENQAAVLQKDNSSGVYQYSSYVSSGCVMDRNGTILAYGDSLTSGFPIHHPYSIQLSSLLDKADVITSGRPGEMTSEMLLRFKEIVARTRPFLVVILAGTNDIMRGVSTQETIANIKALHKYAQTWSDLNSGILKHTIAITVPDIYAGKFDAGRLDVNRGIRTLVGEANGFVKLLELEVIFNQSLSENRMMWYEDALHFSEAGYDALGSLVYKTLCSFT